MVVAATVDHRQVAILVESLEADHRRMEAKAVGDFDHLALGDPDLRPGPVVRRVAEGHDGVQSIIAAGQLNDDEDAVGMLFDTGALQRLRRERRRCAAEDQRQHAADTDAVHPADEEIAP